MAVGNNSTLDTTELMTENYLSKLMALIRSLQKLTSLKLQ